MVTVRVIVGGLGILCLNTAKKQGEIGLLEGVRDHEVKMEIYEVVGDVATLVQDLDTIPPGEIKLEVINPEIDGVLKDDTEIVRTDGPTNRNKHSLRWLLDLETELHGRRLTKNQAPTLVSLRKLLVPNAYFHTAYVREDAGYLQKKGGRISKFGRIGTYLGATIYASQITIKVGSTPIFERADSKHYEVVITNMEPDNHGISDYSNYYEVVQASSAEQLKFLSIGRSLQPDEKSNPDEMGLDDAKRLGIGVHYECWFAYCSQTETIDTFA